MATLSGGFVDLRKFSAAAFIADWPPIASTQSGSGARTYPLPDLAPVACSKVKFTAGSNAPRRH
jgi:hypothetical protein